MIDARRVVRAALGVVALACALAGCGAEAKAPAAAPEGQAAPALAAPDSKAEAPPPPPPVVSSADQGGDAASDVAAIAAAKAQIDALLGAPGEKAKGAAKRAEAAPAAGGASEPSACGTACAALSSMTRATTHLCSLAGDADARCADARAKTKSATERVHAGCPACP